MPLTIPNAARRERTGIVMAVGTDALDALVGDEPHGLLPLGAQSVLEQWIAQLARADCSTVHIVLHESAARVEAILGDGGRWGLSIRYHLARTRDTAYRVLPRITFEDLALLVDATHFDAGEGWQRLVESDRPVTIIDADAQATGIAAINRELVTKLAAVRRDDAATWLSKHIATITSHNVLSFNSAIGILEAQQALMSVESGPLRPFKDGCSEQIRVGRNVTIDPTAEVRQPVVISDHVTVGAHAIIGPNAVLGRGCVVDNDASVVNSVICAMTYVGSGLHVDESVLDGDHIAHARLGATIKIEDRALVDRMGQRSLRRRLGSCLMGVFAAFLWILTRPIAWTPGLTRGPVRSVRTHFIRRFIPGLWDVLRGRRRLVGPVGSVVPTPDWTPPTAEAGLVDELIVRRGRPGTPLETATADAYYAAHAGTAYDAKLLGRYLCRVVVG